MYGLGNKKNILFHKILEEKGVQLFDSTISLIKELKRKNVKIGLATSSKNCKKILEKAAIEYLFDARIDGSIVEALMLKGKPEPDIFVKCCEVMGCRPEKSLMAEDSSSGVEAGCRGKFGLAIGIDRGNNREALLKAGADLVVRDFDEVSIWALNDIFAYTSSQWTLNLDLPYPQYEKYNEALSTLGNGYTATRGAAPESSKLEKEERYPGTYIAGGYNRAKSEIEGKALFLEDLVNFPNWINITFKTPGNDEWFNWRGNFQISRYSNKLDLYDGISVRRFCVQDPKGQRTYIISQRLVHIKKYHLLCQKYSIISEDWSGPIEIKVGIDGSVTNCGVARYSAYNGKHLEVINKGIFNINENDNGIFLTTKTIQSKMIVTMACKCALYIGEKQFTPLKQEVVEEEEGIYYLFTVNMKEGTILVIEKTVSLCTGFDRGTLDPEEAAMIEIKRYADSRFYNLLNSHKIRWTTFWERSDIQLGICSKNEKCINKKSRTVTEVPLDQIKHSELVKKFQSNAENISSKDLQFAIRFHLFHLIQTVNPNNVGLDVSVPARGLNGEAYRGHIFWDETFVFPVYNMRFPEATRSLLLYRYFRLDAARDRARQLGLRGACYPWQSGGSGEEQTSSVHLNPLAKVWYPDYSHLQLHINLAIFYNIWNYFSVTDDLSFILQYGAEMMLEIARFWSMKSTFNSKTGRYEILGVMGPDEFHERYPSSQTAGLNNNSYTNIMVVWCLNKALYVLSLLPNFRRRELIESLHIAEEELDHWAEITEKMTVIFHGDQIISQFQGYEDLKELDWDEYKKKYGVISRLDRILRSEGDSPDRYKVSKQADVCMLFYLLTQEELIGTLKKLGYLYNSHLIKKTIKYYFQRTSHGSTLSLVVFSSIQYQLDREEAWKMYKEFIMSDLCDIQGGTTAEGIHVAMMAASINMLFFHVCGIDTTGKGVEFDPKLPTELNFLKFRFQYKAVWLTVTLTQEIIQVHLNGDYNKTIQVKIHNKEYKLLPESTIEVEYLKK